MELIDKLIERYNKACWRYCKLFESSKNCDSNINRYDNLLSESELILEGLKLLKEKKERDL